MNKLRNKKNFMRFIVKFLLLSTLIFSFSANSFAQEAESDEPSDVVVPEQVMEQVVRRILAWSFKPRNKTKVIYLSEQRIQKSWLPSIKNIEFKLLSAEEVKQREAGVYFFRKLDRDKNRYNVGFAYGDPDCKYWGDNWTFRISNQKVKLWHSGGVGGFCSHSSSSLTISP